MKAAYHIIVHLLGVACIAGCIAIVATMGTLDLHWSGWVAVAFFAMLALGVLIGWFPWRGKPLRMMIKGVYVMSALALFGFGFTLKDPLRPQLWMVLAPVAAAIVLRIAVHITMRGRGADTARVDTPAMTPRRTADDIFN